MDIQIKEVKTRRELKAFIDFPYKLYNGNAYYVPPLRLDEKNTLSIDRNPAFDYCEARYWLAFKGGRVAGRIAGIINHAYIDKWDKRYIRFGWLDFEEDEEVAAALLSRVEAWGQDKGMDAIHGPMGFTDLDNEGMLIDGFDQLGTLATIYNYPYYPLYMQRLGYEKEVDWIEYRIQVPERVPEKVERSAALSFERLGLRVIQLRTSPGLGPAKRS